MVVIHADALGTSEYKDCSPDMLSHIPQPDEWEGQEKCLVVIDDLDVKRLSREQSKALNRLFGYVSCLL